MSLEDNRKVNDNFELPDTYNQAFHGDILSNPYLGRLEYKKLGKTGLRLSQVGLGTAGLGNLFGEINRNEGIAAVQEAIKLGINYIDTAPFYATSQDVLGEALKTVPRETYYIATKVGREPSRMTFRESFDLTPSTILKSFETSLTRLGLPYVDVIQIHDIDVHADLDIILKQALPTLESLVTAGKARFIGITGYDLDFLEKVARQSRVDTVLSFSRYNLHDRALENYLDTFRELNVGVITAAALAQGLLTTNGPPAWHCAPPALRSAAEEAVDLAEAMETTIEEASLGFSLRPNNDTIATTLVSIDTRKMLRQNLDLAIKPRTNKDDLMYAEFRQVFGNKDWDWLGVEHERYKAELLANEENAGKYKF